MNGGAVTGRAVLAWCWVGYLLLLIAGWWSDLMPDQPGAQLIPAAAGGLSSAVGFVQGWKLYSRRRQILDRWLGVFVIATGTLAVAVALFSPEKVSGGDVESVLWLGAALMAIGFGLTLGLVALGSQHGTNSEPQ